jgi:hypothetical protein
MKIGIVGSRQYTNYDEFKLKIKEWQKERNHVIDDTCVIVSGGATGADTLATQFAEDNKLKMITHHPDYDKHGRSAPLKRNTLIINDSDVLLAFPSSSSRGTYDSINKAKKKGIVVHTYLI